MSITEQEYRLAYDEGRRMCRVNRPIEACRKFDSTERGRRLNDAREDGWRDEQRELRAMAGAKR